VAPEARNGDQKDQQSDQYESVDTPCAARMKGSGHGAILNLHTIFVVKEMPRPSFA
jgi:hypothetical protein